ncbi:hypothetical protein [Streptosporangium nondiastaticum]|uniref:hypothetical protein n=1 Tax=Streptosporangium nondiastaticum TaxID=35764 RepID=UPI003F4AF669
MTSPAPSFPRPEPAGTEPELRTDTARDDEGDEPSEAGRERDSRPDTERRDDAERADPDRDDEPCEPEPALPLPFEDAPDAPDAPPVPPVTPVAGEPTDPFGDTTGARPHVSQYSSPPPTSSYEPAHPGR